MARPPNVPLGAGSSALVTPFLLAGVDPDATALTTGQVAAVTALSLLTGSTLAGVAGANSQAGGTWAENEAQNNDIASMVHYVSAIGASQSAIGTLGQAYSYATSSFQSMLSNFFTPSASTVSNLNQGLASLSDVADYQNAERVTPAYVSLNGSALGGAGGTSINLGNGQAYLSGGGAVPVTPSFSLTIGFLPNSGLNPTAATDNFLNGGTYQTSVCDLVCVAVTHSVGGTTGYEFGIGTPGASVSTTVSTPLGGRHW